MEANLAATSALLLSHGFRAHFPILEANKAADTIIFLLETEREPNLAVISLLLSAAKDAVTESTGTSRTGCAKKVKRNEDFAPIQWEALHELWKTFRNVLTADSENFKRWRRKRTGSDSSTESTVSSAEADVVKIYRFITRAVTVSENSSAAPRGGLVKFINAAADTADRKFKGMGGVMLRGPGNMLMGAGLRLLSKVNSRPLVSIILSLIERNLLVSGASVKGHLETVSAISRRLTISLEEDYDRGSLVQHSQ